MMRIYPEKMRSHLLFIGLLASFLHLSEIQAQCPNDFDFERQSQIDSFPILYPDCSDFPGQLKVSGGDITNVLGFSNLKSIQYLNISFNKKLRDLSGFDQVDTIHSGFLLNVNDSLRSLHGLEQLKYVGGTIHMNNNHHLQDLNGLSNLQKVTGQFKMVGSSLVQNLKGLDSLREVYQLWISNNYDLVSYEGIEQLRKVEGLFLIGNYAENVDPFSNLDTIGQMLQITNNGFLTDISGLQNLKEIKGGNVLIRNNPKLSECAAFAICKAIANTPENVTIINNKAGCDSPEELTGDCLSLFNFSAARGKVYADLDCNELFDSTDVLLPNHIIRNQETGVPWASSGPAGSFENLLTPSTTVSILPDSIKGFTSHPLADTFIVTNGLQIFSDRDFKFCPDSSFHNLSVSLFPVTLPVRGFSQRYQVCLRNIGSNYENAILKFSLIDSVGINSMQLTSVQNGFITSDGFEWDIQDLQPFEERCYQATVRVLPTSDLATSFDVKLSVVIAPETIEIDTTDNCVLLTQTIVGSFDPNDKTVSPEKLDHKETADGNWLDYRIRFQNTGTFPATFVEVYDTLESGLDIRTFQMQQASHDYTLSFPDPGVLKWRFDNINLPDSTSDEPNSHGFIAFRIKTVPDLPLLRTVQNRAGIYFDFNEVVLTEFATTSLILEEPKGFGPSMDFNVFPNPFESQSPLYITLENDFIGKIRVEFFSFDGKVIRLFEREKTQLKQRFVFNDLPFQNAFFVRLRDERSVRVKTVMKF